MKNGDRARDHNQIHDALYAVNGGYDVVVQEYAVLESCILHELGSVNSTFWVSRGLFQFNGVRRGLCRC